MTSTSARVLAIVGALVVVALLIVFLVPVAQVSVDCVDQSGSLYNVCAIKHVTLFQLWTHAY